jgi:hypothetical protein
MGMINPKNATCPRCKLTNVLCCSFCGFCANCDTHSFCVEGNGGMKNPIVATCPQCKKTNVLCCTSCGLCGEDDTHDSCNKKLKSHKTSARKKK